jgi:hypothetical protein
MKIIIAKKIIQSLKSPIICMIQFVKKNYNGLCEECIKDIYNLLINCLTEEQNGQ